MLYRAGSEGRADIWTITVNFCKYRNGIGGVLLGYVADLRGFSIPGGMKKNYCSDNYLHNAVCQSDTCAGKRLGAAHLKVY
jgi:hypothetical protein